MTTVSVVSSPNQPYRTAITAGKHTFYADAKVASGGGETAANPHEIMLGALGACTSMTVEMYAKRKQWDVQQVTVNLTESKDPGTKQPKISKEIIVKGNLDAQQLQRLKDIAEKCPVNQLLMNPKVMDSTLNHVV